MSTSTESLETESIASKRARIRREADERRAMYRVYLKTSVSALEMPLAVLVGMLLGRFADQKLGTAPYGLWIGLCFGVATAVRMIRRMIVEQRRQNPDPPDDDASSVS